MQELNVNAFLLVPLGMLLLTVVLLIMAKAATTLAPTLSVTPYVTTISACLKPSPGVCYPVEADTRHFLRAVFSLRALYSPHVGFYCLL